MKTLTDEDMDKLIAYLQEALIRKDNPLNRQDIDYELSAHISVFKHGEPGARETAKRWICSFANNAGIINKTYKL